MRPLMPDRWRFDYRPSPALPPLAWVARVGDRVVTVDCGPAVRREAGGFFEGTWVGPSGLSSVAGSTTPFGTGMVVAGDDLLAIPPGHTLGLVFTTTSGTEMLVANTLVGLLASAGSELLAGVDYGSLFARVADGLAFTPTELPTSGSPVAFHFYENLRVLPGGRLEQVAKAREAPFTSFRDYVERLDAALASALVNAPGYPPVVALSNGYDSPAVAIIAARRGCRTALTFQRARPPVWTRDTSDSGEHFGRALGMDVRFFDRDAYLRRDDLPEAEFLACGYTGEEVVLSAMEGELRHTALLTGGLGGAMWLRGKEPHTDLRRHDFSACSMTEFRLRLDLIDLPISLMGMTALPSLVALANSPEMHPYSVGGYYDKPVPRRIIEEAGFERGTFATSKRAATALIHRFGEAALAPATLASVRAFAATEGRGIDLSPRRRRSRLERGMQRLAHRLHLRPLERWLVRRDRAIVRHRPEAGAILLRWAVASIRSRYDAIRPARTTGGSGRARRPA